LLLLAVIALSCGRPASDQPASARSGSAAATNRPLRIAVIPKGTTHSFWKSVESGARQAGQELGAEIIWKGPLKENDRATQIEIVQDFAVQNVDGVVLAPLDSAALLRPVRDAARKKIPVVIFDSALDGTQGTDFISFVATDNLLAGRLAGQQMVDKLGGKGKVVLLRYQVGSASTTSREQGFEEVLAQHSGMELISKNQYSGATVAEAQQTAENMLDVLRQADGIFCPNESSTFGMLLALRQHGLAGKKIFVGFDSAQPLNDALAAGEIQGLVVQNPRQMGYLGVKTLVQHVRGETVQPRIDTGATLVTAENMADPEVARLIQPVDAAP
jgi:ribose transport system substrate-binding protein